MRVIQTNEPIVLKGRYLVTDPCYIYNDGDGDWGRFCDLLFGNEERVAGVSRKSIPLPDYDSLGKMADPKEAIKAIMDANKAYEAKRNEADIKWGESRRSVITLFEIDGKQVPVMSTAYGDGGYPVFDPTTGTEVGSFGVDAGLFAFIPWTGELGMRSDLGTIIELEGVLTCEGGDAFINGKLVVDTSGQGSS
jgi:hypothetical protein